MNRKIKRLMKSETRLFFIVLVAFAAAAVFANLYLALAELAAAVALFFYARCSAKKRQDEILDYIASNSVNISGETRDVLLSFPLPLALINPQDETILWSNRQFLELTGDRRHVFERRVTDTVGSYSSAWLLDGKAESPEPVEINGRSYRLYGSLLRPEKNGKRNLMAAVCWVDVTAELNIRGEYEKSRPIIMVIMLDNYDELLNNLTEQQKSALLAAIDERIGDWTKDTGGYLSKYDRDRYSFVFEERHLAAFIEGKFSVLDSVHSIVSPNGVAASLSIGVGKDGGSFDGNFRYALLGIEMSLGRGGDQAVIKNRFNFEFYGGRSKEMERHTKVKSRTMANSLRELIKESSGILIMGHKQSDFDSVGAASGLVCVARRLGKQAKIIIDRGHTAAEVLVRKLEALPEYSEVFIDAETAMLIANSRTLLIVVDTNRPEQVESREILESCNHVAVIDHHRRAAEYIQNTELNFHEPYASSACELVSEIVQYLCEQSDILRAEAEAMLTGMVLDTKNFTMRTGGRTFEAAAFLRRTGADTSDVKRLMQNGLEDTLKRYRIIQKAQIVHGDIAVCAIDDRVDRITAAQAADELLNISGISCSFVLYPDEGQVIVSARSIGDVNVQTVLEKLGGGGNKATAGAQIAGSTVHEVLADLNSAIDAQVGEIRE